MGEIYCQLIGSGNLSTSSTDRLGSAERPASFVRNQNAPAVFAVATWIASGVRML